MEQNEQEIMIYKDSLNNVEYIIEFNIVADKIHMKIKENNEFAPFTYEEYLTLNDFIGLHKIFKSCTNVKEILGHLYTLYKNKKIYINDVGEEDKRNVYFKVWNISKEEDTKTFDLERKMVENKDEALIELFLEQKRQKKKIKEIEQLIAKGFQDSNLLKKNILNVLSGKDNK